LRVAAVPAVLAGVRAFVRAEFAAAGLEARADEAVEAANEAVSNAVMHAYPDGPGLVQITVKFGLGRATIVVSDEGCGIASARGPGGAGFGFTIMDGASDSLQVASDPSKGTRVSLMYNRPSG
jgi:stage II sporulation protein AB (anti-sigma F factor)